MPLMETTRTVIHDIAIVGAGPAGLACAVDAVRRGLIHVVIDKGTAVNSIVGFPPRMTFFSTAQNLELHPMPFTTPHLRPTREEVIEYYLGVIRKGRVRLRLRTTVLGAARREDGLFTVSTDRGPITARHVVLATGYFDHVNRLDVPGEDLPKVHHYYHEPYPFYDQDVLVIGGRNSAAETALDLWRHGARVTLVHRGEGFRSVKYWILPDIENRVREGSITAHWSTSVSRVDETTVTLHDVATGEEHTIANDAVFAMIGYRPDEELFRSCGIEFDPETLVPRFDPKTYESSVENIFIAGSVACGCRTWEIFIENGKEHAAHVVAEIARRMS
jgi:thioredoxin reductase (NADPH)